MLNVTEEKAGSLSGKMNDDVRQTMVFAMRYSFTEQNIVALCLERRERRQMTEKIEMIYLARASK